MEHYLRVTFYKELKIMRYYLFCLALISSCCFGQTNSSSAYRPLTLNEKNIAKSTSITDSFNFQYSFLIKEKDLKNELTDYFKEFMTTSDKITSFEIVKHNNLFYLKISYNQSELISLLHVVEIPGIDAYFFVLGSHSCFVSKNEELCFPLINDFAGISANANCHCFSTKKD